MTFESMKKYLSHQREMSLREVLLTDLMFVLKGMVMVLGLLIVSPVLLIGILGECEYS